MSSSSYIVEGMTCGSCAGKVTDKVEAIHGVTDVDVDLATGELTLTIEAPASVQAVKQAVEEAGYKVTVA